jgi:hypothetical protein
MRRPLIVMAALAIGLIGCDAVSTPSGTPLLASVNPAGSPAASSGTPEPTIEDLVGLSAGGLLSQPSATARILRPGNGVRGSTTARSSRSQCGHSPRSSGSEARGLGGSAAGSAPISRSSNDHFAATALLEAGEDQFVVSRILGHTSVATTASFYGHVQPAMLRASADRMEELMRKASGT